MSSFTKVPNEVLEALTQTNLCAYETRVLMLIIRKTYGWHKETDWISLSQNSNGTGIRKPHICRAIKSLAARNIIVKGRNKQVGLQLDYERWIKLPRKVTSLPR